MCAQPRMALSGVRSSCDSVAEELVFHAAGFLGFGAQPPRFIGFAAARSRSGGRCRAAARPAPRWLRSSGPLVRAIGRAARAPEGERAEDPACAHERSNHALARAELFDAIAAATSDFDAPRLRGRHLVQDDERAAARRSRSRTCFVRAGLDCSATRRRTAAPRDRGGRRRPGHQLSIVHHADDAAVADHFRRSASDVARRFPRTRDGRGRSSRGRRAAPVVAPPLCDR